GGGGRRAAGALRRRVPRRPPPTARARPRPPRSGVAGRGGGRCPHHLPGRGRSRHVAGEPAATQGRGPVVVGGGGPPPGHGRGGDRRAGRVGFAAPPGRRTDDQHG